MPAFRTPANSPAAKACPPARYSLPRAMPPMPWITRCITLGMPFPGTFAMRFIQR